MEEIEAISTLQMLTKQQRSRFKALEYALKEPGSIVRFSSNTIIKPGTPITDPIMIARTKQSLYQGVSVMVSRVNEDCLWFKVARLAPTSTSEDGTEKLELS